MLIDKLVVGSFGNISAREGDMIAITPSGVDYEDLEPENSVVVDLGGRSIEGDLKPSSELAMHTYIYKARADIQAIVHTHSTYATYGTKTLAENALNALGKTHKVAILENHGAIAVGKTVNEAYQSVVILEHVAEIYLKAQAIGEPIILPPHQIEEVKRQFESYGQVKPKG
jgi:L-fuculose-phosphate aldolase